MEHITYTPKEVSKEAETQLFWKYFLFTYNLLVFMCGCVLMSIGIWMAVDRNFMTTIIGNNLYGAAVFMILVGGAVIFFVSFFGCCGVITSNRCMLFTYCVVLCVIFACLFIGGLLAAAFKQQIGDKVKDSMSNTLTTFYGINFQNEYNRAVTDAWDKAQERLQCCAVETNGWYTYRKSKWFDEFGSRQELQLAYEENLKPYVPQSCCVKDRFWRYINLDVCQKWRIGPPGSPVDGAINRALYYQGCYDAALHYLTKNAVILIGLGIALGLLLIVGIIVSVLLLRGMKKENVKNGTAFSAN